MLLTKIAVVMICLFFGTVRTKSTSDIYEELEEALEILKEERRAADTEDSAAGSLDEDVVDVTSRMSRRIRRNQVEKAFRDAEDRLEEEFAIRNKHFLSGIDFPPGGSSGASMAGLNDIVSGTEAEREENKTLIALFATEILADQFNLRRVLRSQTVRDVFSEREGEGECIDNKPVCHIDCTTEVYAKYRKIDGTCNNIYKPLLGSTNTPQVRLLPAEYEDGIGAVKMTGKGGYYLPSARTVSRIVLRNESNLQTPDDPERSVMVTVWGQFLDHDLTETPMTKGRDNTNVGCCTLPEDERDMRSQCAVIIIEPGDHHFDNTTTCMDLVRSRPTRQNRCVPGVREQINAITSFIDGSQVYGSEEELAHELRLGVLGLMKVEGDNLLPANDDSTCLLTNKNDHCQLAGDVRVNENPHLGAIHIAFVRYHNILARRFKSAGLTDDEEIYQRSRKIIGGIMQHVTYSAWLPGVIGQTTMTDFGLTLDNMDPYNDGVDPSGINEFSTAAMRYGHTLVSQKLIQLNDAFRKTPDSDQMDNHFFRPDMISDSTQLTNLARWMVSLSCKKIDPFFVPAIHDNLFVQKLGDGLDLAALNIQRGREHGLPGYTDYRRFCKLSVPRRFNQLRDHTPYFRDKLEQVYGDVRNIDLFVGAMTENSISDGRLGSTFACLMGHQFRAVKQGDRYWFERPTPEGMRQDQRDNIKDVSLAKIICEVFGIDRIQKDIFKVPRLNQLENCSDLNDIDVSLWI